jgi:hypothetical protein
MERTRNASIRRPATSTNASCWNVPIGTKASAAKEADRTGPAPEIAWMIAACSGRCAAADHHGDEHGSG